MGIKVKEMIEFLQNFDPEEEVYASSFNDITACSFKLTHFFLDKHEFEENNKSLPQSFGRYFDFGPGYCDGVSQDLEEAIEYCKDMINEQQEYIDDNKQDWNQEKLNKELEKLESIKNRKILKVPVIYINN